MNPNLKLVKSNDSPLQNNEMEHPPQTTNQTTSSSEKATSTPSSKAPITGPKLTEKGKLDVAEGFVGLPGSGKSTCALARAIQLQKEHSAYLVCHDVGWRLPDNWPNGQPTNLLRHESIEDCRQALQREPGRVHTVACPDATEVMKFAQEISKSSMDQYSSDKDRRGVPVFILVDEIVAYDSAGSYRLGDDLRQALTGRRHHNIGILWTSQMARMCHKSLIALCTQMWLFKITFTEDLKRLEEGNIPREHLQKLPTLQRGQHIIVKNG